MRHLEPPYEYLPIEREVCGRVWHIAQVGKALSEDEAREIGWLFAAAPDLLAACEAVVAWDEEVRSTGHGFTLDMRPIRAAIAKARGGSDE